MGTLGAGKERRLRGGRAHGLWIPQEINTLAAQKPHPLSSRLASAPVSPQERGRSGERSRGLDRAIGGGRRTEDGTHPARLRGFATVALASFSHWARTTITPPTPLPEPA